MSEFHPGRSIIGHCLLSWEIPKEARIHLSEYYLLHWKSAYYFSLPLFSTLEQNGIPYHVQFYECNPLSLHRYEEILVSFRRPKDWDCGYALIRPKFGTEKS